jgi:hypothetical protein
MRAEPRRSTTQFLVSGRRKAAVSASLVTLLAAMPTTAAIAASSSAGGGTSSSSSISLPLGELEKLLSTGEANSLLAGLPISDLNVTKLSEELSSLPGLTGLTGLLTVLGGPAKLQEALSTAIAALGPNATLDDVLDPTTLASHLVTSITGLLGPVLGPTLGVLLGGGEPTAVLTSALGSLNEGQLLGPLLGSASNPTSVVEGLISAVSPSTVEGLLGSTLTGEPFSQTTVGALASSLGTTAETLADDVGQTAQELPATAMALTAPLTNGKLLAVLNGLGGLSLTVLNPSTPTGGETGGTGGSGGAGGSGGTSGSGGSGGASGESGSGSSTPGSTTVVVNTPAAQASSLTPAAVLRAATPAVGHVRVLKHQVKGRVATIIVQVPAAGKVTLSGKHVRSSSRLAAKAELVTLKVTLAKATSASLHKNHKHLKVSLKTAFKPLSGASSSASVTVNF